jgi:2-dehydro-3-deoxyphosphogluconate aldolase/(4S)-4-hydroxy-2-oxoglutarate aldolase
MSILGFSRALRQWLALSNVTVVGGSWLTPEVDLRAGAWDRITERARRESALRK